MEPFATDQGWNEIVVDHRGTTFVNAISFDLMGGEEPKAGHVWAVLPDGSSREVAEDVWFPNGMVVSGETLIVAESYRNRLTGFDIAADGGLAARRTWADLQFAPDGICLDDEGGTVLERVDADRGCFACMLGGDEGRTLYVVANAWGGIGVAVSGGQVLTHRAPAAHAGRP